jgi:ABC-2 type transport system ATP-binding protein
MIGYADFRSTGLCCGWGCLGADRSLDELRAGVASALPGVEQGQRFTLEEIFLAILGADGHQESTQELSWLA